MKKVLEGRFWLRVYFFRGGDDSGKTNLPGEGFRGEEIDCYTGTGSEVANWISYTLMAKAVGIDYMSFRVAKWRIFVLYELSCYLIHHTYFIYYYTYHHIISSCASYSFISVNNLCWAYLYFINAFIVIILGLYRSHDKTQRC